MNIAPTQGTNPSRITLRTQPVARKPFPTPAPPPATPAAGPSSPNDTINGLEQEFEASQASLTSLIAQLSRRLASIESTFISALQTLAKSFESNASGAASPARGTSAAQAASADEVNPYDGLIRRSAQRHQRSWCRSCSRLCLSPAMRAPMTGATSIR
jgi:hypothetical protein